MTLHITVTDEEFDIVAEGYDAGVRFGEDRPGHDRRAGLGWRPQRIEPQARLDRKPRTVSCVSV